tara:strand:+ start:14460 stop:15536 length:1077 start_codon:yes stop_codon:yes gene_type:complete
MSYLQSHMLAGVDKPLIIHWNNGLNAGGTEGMQVVFHQQWQNSKMDNPFNHKVAYRKQSENSREQQFKDLIGEENLICVDDNQHFVDIVKELQPYIVHRYAAGIPEFPLVPEIKEHTKYLISTAVFGNQDDSIDIDAVIYVSKHIQHMVQTTSLPNHYVVRNPVQDKLSNESLRSELDIPEDDFVFGRIGRSDADIYDPINIKAYAKICNNNTHFVAISPSELLINDALSLGVNNFHIIKKTTDMVRLSKFYNTIDVLAHARKDGECNPAVMFESFSHGKPVISHYGWPFNGHIECIGEAGFTVMAGDINEYAKIMKKFVDKTVDFSYISKRAREQYLRLAFPFDRAKEQMEIYKGLL